MLAFPPGAIATGNFNTNGGLAGGTVGGNVQWGAAVLGIEGDWDWSNINGTSNIPFGCVTGLRNQGQLASTVRGRAGWAIDRVLLYGTGGAAFAPVQAGFTVRYRFQSTTQVGWTAGAGLEFAFAPNWTAKAEYLYADLGSFNLYYQLLCATPLTSNSPTTSFARASTSNLIRGDGSIARLA